MNGIWLWEIQVPQFGTDKMVPYPTKARSYRFTEEADAQPTLKSVQAGQPAGNSNPDAKLVWVFVKNAKALEEVYCRGCGKQTSSSLASEPIKRFTTCYNCSLDAAYRKAKAAAVPKKPVVSAGTEEEKRAAR